MTGKAYWLSIMQVAGGVIIGQLIGILGFLFLTWIYSPKEFGVYASWSSIVMIGAVLCTGALETSLVRDGDGSARCEAAANVVWTALLGATFYGGMCMIGLSALPALIPGNSVLVATSIGIAAFALATSVVFQSWAAAEGKFRQLTLLRIAQSSLVMFFPLGLSMVGTTSDQLIWGHTCGLIISLMVWLLVYPPATLRPRSLVTLTTFWAGRTRCFIYVLPALLIGSLTNNLLQLTVNFRFGAETAGYLALTQRVLGMPLSLVGIAVRDVFKRYASVAFRGRGECVREFWNTLGILSVVSAVFGLVMFSLSEILFALVFGESWRPSGQLASSLLPMFVIGIVASPLTYLVYIVQREDFDLLWQTALLLLVAVVLFAFADIGTTLRVFACSYAVMYVIYIYACARFARGENFIPTLIK